MRYFVGRDYIEVSDRADAFEIAGRLEWCDQSETYIGTPGNTFAGRAGVLPRVIFEHKSVAEYEVEPTTYLTVVCLDCAPKVWARLTVAAEEQAAERTAL